MQSSTQSNKKQSHRRLTQINGFQGRRIDTEAGGRFWHPIIIFVIELDHVDRKQFQLVECVVHLEFIVNLQSFDLQLL